MAPKKKSENKSAPKKTTDKITKSRGKNIKVKFPLKNLKNGVVKKKSSPEKKPSLTEPNLKNMLIIGRMNEVARAQLVKDCPVVDTESPPKTVPVKKRGGRKKKIVEPETPEVPKKKLKGAAAKAPVRTKNTKKPKAATLKQKTPPVKKRRGRPPNRGKPKTDDSTITSPSILGGSLLDTKTAGNDALITPMKTPLVPTSTENNSDSRRTSVTSAPASEWSWTKDLSGSSTTTCITVGSTDFVRIDGKLPELKLKKIDPALMEEAYTVTETNDAEHSLSEDSSTSSSSSSSDSSNNESTAIENDLNLSTSSISISVPHSPTYTPADQSFDKNKLDLDEVTSILEMLAPSLKSLDLSFPDIEDENDSFDMRPFEEKISVYLHEEYNTILECNFLNQILTEDLNVSKANNPEVEQKAVVEPDFVKPDVTVVSNKSLCDYRNDVSSDITRRRDTYDPNDDDDALSLFAESITGMDSSRLSSAASVACTAPNYEEYVPQPVMRRDQTAVKYQPTAITQPPIIEAEAASTKTKTVCEKHNADSTSIYKEPELVGSSGNHIAPVNKTVPQQNLKQAAIENDRPKLTILSYTYPKYAKSVTVHGVCFFNLISTCSKRESCLFPHNDIGEEEFKRRLAALSEEQFFQEYTAIGKWPKLRRKYVKCFADECQRRELPKILVEIVVDFMFKAQKKSEEDAVILVKLIESALMYLNSWDLTVCEQLLMCNVGGVIVCDVFMKTIGNSQNFSQFKNVFVKLTDLMVRANRTFNLEVASHILERVCILPFETQLATRLVSIVERTDRKIFENNMMNLFEMLLNNFNKELCNRLLSIRTESVTSEKLKPVSEPCPPSLPSPCGSRGSRELEPLVIAPNNSHEYEQRYTSPDTTNTDNLNKPVHEPVIIRTLNHLNPIRPPNMCNAKQGPRQMFPDQWNQRSIMSKIPRFPQMRPQKRPLRPPLQRPQFKYQRRYGPDFYGTGT